MDAGYFDVVSIPILAGRTFDVGDRGGAQPVAIVNHTLAQQAFGTDDVVGRLLGDRLIVGLVADVRHRRLDEPTEPEMYLPVAQHNEDRLSLVVLADRAPEALYGSVREAVHAVDPAQPISNLTTFGELKARSPGVTERRCHGRAFLVVAMFSALLGSRLLQHVVFGVAAAEAGSFVSTVAIVTAVVALAGVVPAMRVGRLDVATSLWL